MRKKYPSLLLLLLAACSKSEPQNNLQVNAANTPTSFLDTAKSPITDCPYLELNYPDDWRARTIQELINYFAKQGNRLAWRLGVFRDYYLEKVLGMTNPDSGDINMLEALKTYGEQPYFDPGLGEEGTLYDFVCTDKSNVFPPKSQGLNFDNFLQGLTDSNLEYFLGLGINIVGLSVTGLGLLYFISTSYVQTKETIKTFGLKETLKFAVRSIVDPYLCPVKHVVSSLNNVYKFVLEITPIKLKTTYAEN